MYTLSPHATPLCCLQWLVPEDHRILVYDQELEKEVDLDFKFQRAVAHMNSSTSNATPA